MNTDSLKDKTQGTRHPPLLKWAERIQPSDWLKTEGMIRMETGSSYTFRCTE